MESPTESAESWDAWVESVEERADLAQHNAEFLQSNWSALASRVETLERENEELRERLSAVEEAQSERIEWEDEDEVLGRLDELEREVSEAVESAIEAGTVASRVEDEWESKKEQWELKWHKINEVREVLEEKGLL